MTPQILRRVRPLLRRHRGHHRQKGIPILERGQVANGVHIVIIHQLQGGLHFNRPVFANIETRRLSYPFAAHTGRPDNGPGIDDERKKKVFEPFYTTKPAGSGTGLGLSQSYEIIAERHGGTLRVVDTEGGGATFVITVPG